MDLTGARYMGDCNRVHLVVRIHTPATVTVDLVGKP